MSFDPVPLGIPGLESPRVIGRGGFGTVYAAEEPEFGRSVAVKVLHDRLDGDDVRRAFVRECRAMGALSGHPHIVTVHRGGTTAGGEPYIVMDLMSGGSLADRLRRDGPLPWPDVLEIAVTVAGALETAHRAGILHLDLKPANLLVSRFGQTTLGDFGISRLPGVTESTAGRVRASIAYAAPERLLEGAATVASDLYGLGATLFALLAGRSAHGAEPGEELLVTVARIVRDPLPDLRTRGVPDAVAWVVERLMAKAPADRFATAAEVADILQAAQRTTGRAVTRAVVEGAEPGTGDTVTWPARPLVPGLTPGALPASPGGPTAATAPAAAAAHPTMVGAPVQPRPPRPGPPVPPQGGRRPPAGPPASNRRPLLLAGVAAAVVVGLGATGAALLAGQAGNGDPATPASVVAAPPTSAPVTDDADPTAAALPPDLPIDVAPGVEHRETVPAARVLGGYFVAINEARYDDAFAVFSPESSTYRGGPQGFADAQSSTVIMFQRVNAVRDGAAGGLEADVTFRSTQLAELGFEGQTCTDWNLTYEMTGPGPEWKVLRARSIEPPAAC